MTNETTKSQNNVHQLSHNLLAGDKSCSFFHSDSFVSGKSLVIFEEIESWWKLQKGKKCFTCKVRMCGWRAQSIWLQSRSMRSSVFAKNFIHSWTTRFAIVTGTWRKSIEVQLRGFWVSFHALFSSQFHCRLMWFCIHVFGACSLYYFITTSYESFVLNPLVTTLFDTVYPVKYIPFPAVSICSNNRISRSEATAFARELWVWDFSEFHYFFWLISTFQIFEGHFRQERVAFLEGNYLPRSDLWFRDRRRASRHRLSAVNGSDDWQKFCECIEIQFRRHHPQSRFPFDSLKIHWMKFLIFQLTPKCENLLIKCFFKSKEYKCMMDYQMMEQRQNARGFCCSFNYMRKDDNNPL